jgi:DNA-binding LytR/AlgR family response regulator
MRFFVPMNDKMAKPTKEPVAKKKRQMSIKEYFIRKLELPKGKQGKMYIPLNFITYIEVHDGELHIHFEKSVTLSYDRNMCDLHDLFPEPHFMQCHESYIVNLHFVMERIPGDGGKLLVFYQATKGYVEIPISRFYKDTIINALNKQSIVLPAKKVVVKDVKKGKKKIKVL